MIGLECHTSFVIIEMLTHHNYIPNVILDASNMQLHVSILLHTCKVYIIICLVHACIDLKFKH